MASEPSQGSLTEHSTHDNNDPQDRRSLQTLSDASWISSETVNTELTVHSLTASAPTNSVQTQGLIQAPNKKMSMQISNFFSKLEALCSRWWYWELACILLGICCKFAVVVILCTVDRTALDAWNFPIQPNSLVSVFMTVAKSSLLLPVAECISQVKWIQFEHAPHHLIRLQEYDEASRGPWGSFQLLFSWKTGSFLAYAGAVLTTMVLALEPFTQQIITYPSRLITSKSQSASQAATRDLQFVNQVAMNGAVLEGIYFSELTSNAFDCTTSTCSWPGSFVSLGVCSACCDVTSIMNATCETHAGPLAPTNEDSWSFKTTDCTYSLNNTFSLPTYIQTIHFPSENGRSSENASEWTQVKMTSPDVADGLGNLLKPNRTYLATVLSYSTFFDKGQKRLPEVTPDLLDPKVFACGLYWCGHVYTNSSVINGTLRTTKPSSAYNLGMIYDSDGSNIFIQTNETRSDVFRVPEEDRATFPANDTFTVSQTAHLKLSHFFYQLFNITNLSGNEDFSVFPEREQGLYGISDVIFKDRNITQTFENNAAAMTEQVRVSNSSYRVKGLAWENETYVLVRWEWMTLPLAVLVMSVAYLVTTIAANGARRERIWKSSSLALLYHGLNGWSHEDLRAENVQDMNKMAKKMKAQLTYDSERNLEFHREQ